jgi:hypothetical protein
LGSHAAFRRILWGIPGSCHFIGAEGNFTPQRLECYHGLHEEPLGNNKHKPLLEIRLATVVFASQKYLVLKLFELIRVRCWFCIINIVAIQCSKLKMNFWLRGPGRLRWSGTRLSRKRFLRFPYLRLINNILRLLDLITGQRK